MSRAATGRSLVLKFHGHYHGWAGALGVGANFDVAPGIAPPPEAPNSGGASPDVEARTLVLDWNDAAAVREVFAAHGNERAAVFCEPYLHSYTNAPPAPGFSRSDSSRPSPALGGALISLGGRRPVAEPGRRSSRVVQALCV
jgi:glutamate-1-semialdehyde 2,1-aminomutase